MKKICSILSIILVSSFVCVTANAATQFIKYKKYLVPIAVSDTLVLETGPAASITSNSAILNLSLQSGEPDISVWFEFSTTAQATCSQSAPADAVVLTVGQQYQLQRNGLSADSIYYFRACANNTLGDQAAGTILSFRTRVLPTVVKTFSAKQISQTAAKLSGRVESGANVTTWFVYSTSSSATACLAPQAPFQSNQNIGDVVSRFINSLLPNTRYYFRYCGQGSDGIFNGELNSFTTLKTTVVETRPAINIAQASAKVFGRITEGNDITTWFLYGLSANLVCDSAEAPTAANGYSGTTRSRQIISLNPNTTYYYVFCGVGLDGTKSGGVKSFTTLADPTSLSFVGIENRTDNGAELTFELMSGQNVETWYVIGQASSTQNCSTSTKRNVLTLQAGEQNVYTTSGFPHWTNVRATFCAKSLDGTIDSISRVFVTLRKVGYEYEVQCSDTRMYNSVNGPLRFFVRTPPPSFPGDDHATFTIYNDGAPRQYFRQSRVSSLYVNILSGKTGPVSIDPAFPIGTGGNRFYRLQILGDDPWRAVVGCITEDVFRKTSDNEEENQ